MTELITIVKQWVENAEKSLISSYYDDGLKASGNWERELSSEIIKQGNGAKILITGARYTGALVGGRRPTSSAGGGAVTLRQVIRRWIDDKGITPRDNISKDSLAYIIARHIHQHGIKVPNGRNSGRLVDRAINSKTIDELGDLVNKHSYELVKSKILDVLKK